MSFAFIWHCISELFLAYNHIFIVRGMKRAVYTPYFDPEFHNLYERVNGPSCRVNIDNESLEDCTVVKIDCVNKQGMLLDVVQVLTDMNLTILKGYISCDVESWYMDVFHVKDEQGNKITDQAVIDCIQQVFSPSSIGTHGSASPKMVAESGKLFEITPHGEPTAIELTGTDRPGLFSEISAVLADLQCNIVEAHAWSHNARLACVAYISDQSTDTPIDDHRLAAIEHHLRSVLRASTGRNPSYSYPNQQEVKTSEFCGAEGTITMVERRLHQLLHSSRDFDEPISWPICSPLMPLGMVNVEGEEEKTTVSIESCEQKKYSIVTIKCKDRRRLMFDTVCTLTDMQYVIFHASVNARKGYAFQEYFIRHVDGGAMKTDGEKERVVKCLEAAMKRRVCEGIRLELSADNRVGLLSDITRVLREHGLAVVRADVATQGEKAVNAFYVRDISGNNIFDMKFVKSIEREMGSPIDLEVKNETVMIKPSSPEKSPSYFSIGNMLKSQIERFSHSFVPIK